MSFKQSRKLTFEEFGDLLQQEWEEGNIGNDVYNLIESGVVPIQLLREKLRWIIERDGDGLRLTYEPASKDIPKNTNESDYPESLDKAA